MKSKLYPDEYTEQDISWLKENFEPEYLKEIHSRKSVKCLTYLNGNEAKNSDGKEVVLKYNKKKLESLGGTKLVKLYENYGDFSVTSTDLKIRESNLRSHMFRLREKLNIMNISPTMLDKLLRS